MPGLTLKCWLVALLLARTCAACVAQQAPRVNVIISMNGDVPTGFITDFKTTVVWDSAHQEVFSTPYYPGSLTVDAAMYQKMAQRAPQAVSFRFYHTAVVNNKTRTRAYEVQVSPAFVHYRFYVISFVDHAAGYTYNLSSPEGQVIGNTVRLPAKARK